MIFWLWGIEKRGVRAPRMLLCLALLLSAPSAAIAHNDDWRLWMGFLGGIRRWGGPLSVHRAELECRRALDTMYEITAKEWVTAKAKGSLDDFEFRVYRCFPSSAPPGPVIAPG